MEALDPQLYGTFGIAGVALVLVFRSWWRTDGSWSTLFDSARKDAADARADAAIARADASAARAAEVQCRIRLDELRQLESHTPPGGYSKDTL